MPSHTPGSAAESAPPQTAADHIVEGLAVAQAGQRVALGVVEQAAVVLEETRKALQHRLLGNAGNTRPAHPQAGPDAARLHHRVDQQGAAVFLQLHHIARPMDLGQLGARARIVDLGHRQRQPTVVAQPRFGDAVAVRGDAQQREFFGRADFAHGAQQAQIEQVRIADGGQVHHPFQQRCVGHGFALRRADTNPSCRAWHAGTHLGLKPTGITATTGNEDAETSASPAGT